MPHAVPPEHEDSPASTFATVQPGAGVVADDVPVKNPNANVPITASEANEQGLGKDEAEREPDPAPGEANWVDPEVLKELGKDKPSHVSVEGGEAKATKTAKK